MKISRFKRTIHKFKDVFFFYILGYHLFDCESVLDVGCGSNSPLRMMKRKSYSEGIDIFKPDLEKSKKNNIHTAYKVGDIRKLKKYYKAKSFDAVIALDVIEHLNKKEAISLLRAMKTIAKKKVIILTPNEFYHQGEHEHNPYQEHLSAWEVNDLKNLGFKVYGLRGYKKIRGEFTTIKYKPWVFWGFISLISEFLLYYFPNLSYHLLAINKIQNDD